VIVRASDARPWRQRRRQLAALGRFTGALVVASPRRVAECVAVTFGLGLIEGVGLLLLVPLLQLVGVDARHGSLGGVIDRFSAVFAAAGVRPTLPIVLGVYVLVVTAQSLMQRRQATLSAALQYDIVDGLRSRVYRAVAGAKWVYFSRNRSSDYAHVLTIEVDRVATVAYYLIDVAATGVISIVYVGLAFRVSPLMTTFVLLCGALMAVAVRGRFDSARASGEERSTASARLYSAIGDHLASMKMAKSYGAEGRHAALFARLSRALCDVHRATVGDHAQARQWLAAGSALLLAVIVYVAYGILGMSAGSILLLLFLFARLVPRLTGLYEKAQVLASELPAFESVMEVEQRCLAAGERPVLPRQDIVFNDRVELDRVTFTYGEPGQSSPAVHDISLVVPTRATTAIVGPSGGGKSTIADLLMGLLEPASGQILVDGHLLDQKNVQAWRNQIGYVSQDTFLFHDTVRANLLWAKPDANEDDLWHALSMAAADDFVRALPQGLNTVVGDRGVLVSGGERQRLSLARALLRLPKLLILDEATNALDPENERRIQQAIERLHEQITIVIITHRLSTIGNADVIHVIDHGAIVESGSWHDLLHRQSGRFRDLCRAQGLDPGSARAEKEIERTRVWAVH
jgi:ATP-binding cassette, subfamily C, bacterial